MQQNDSTDNVLRKSAIVEAFAKAKSITFLAKNFNHIQYIRICFGKNNSPLSLKYAMSLVGITPQMLKPVFRPALSPVKTYEQLGYFPLSRMESFQELARILGKSVEVVSWDNLYFDCIHLFTVDSFGQIKAAKT